MKNKEESQHPEILRGVPGHIGIIMDGNGRWATLRKMHRTRGHREGVEAAKRVILEAINLGVEHVTLYAFSTENWKRTEEEVSFLMALVARNLRDQYQFYRENNIRVHHIGDIAGLPEEVRREIALVQEETEHNSALTVHLAINYGGRNEIIRAVNRWIEKHGQVPLAEQDLTALLDLESTPEPDLIIRTGGERRLSNFLLWESAYAEFYFSNTLWPDWTETELRAAVEDFRNRKRNFGGMPAMALEVRPGRVAVGAGALHHPAAAI